MKRKILIGAGLYLAAGVVTSAVGRMQGRYTKATDMIVTALIWPLAAFNFARFPLPEHSAPSPTGAVMDHDPVISRAQLPGGDVPKHLL